MVVVGGHLTGRMHAAVAGSTVITLASSLNVPIVAVGGADPAGLPESPRDLPVMVGVDGSETSLRAAEFAAGEARQHRTKLVIAHVKVASWPEASVATFYEQMRENHPGLDLEYRAVVGHAADGLVDASRDARLLVVGTRGLGGLKGLLVGSVSQGLLRDAECPVAIVPHTWRPSGIANERPSQDVASAAG
jgi:nucleotide-binding universal stress UspA family protein